MPSDPRMRASDTDRDRTASLLREHHAEGRLNAEEFHERLDRAFAARTLGELDELLADLPAIDLYRLPAAGIRPAPPGARRRRGGSGGGGAGGGGGSAIARRGGAESFLVRESAWVAWAAVSVVLMMVWAGGAAIDGGLTWLPWFLLVSAPWAIHLLRRHPHDR
jgi:hypothetical protein